MRHRRRGGQQKVSLLPCFQQQRGEGGSVLGFGSATARPRRFTNQSAAAATADATDGVDGGGDSPDLLTHGMLTRHLLSVQQPASVDD